MQNRAIPAYQPEQIPAGATFSKFTPPANTGLGFLEAVTDATIISSADPNDSDGDGISGRPNWIKIPSYCVLRPGTIESNGKYIGRFGKKAAVYDLLQQTSNAYNQDVGVNTVYEKYSTYSALEVDPEVSNGTALDVVFYLKTLKAPVPRNQSNEEVKAGKQLFVNTGCAKCHTPQLQTGSSWINALANKTFFPYTDLLLHDMGNELNDGYTEGSALPAEWRTPPLWGISSFGPPYMHDGSAPSLTQAILHHQGEASEARDAYVNSSKLNQEQLVNFLRSL